MAEGLDPQAVVVVVNSAVVSAVLIGGGAWLAHGELSVESPGKRQHVGEAILQFFVGKARDMAPPEPGPEHDRVMRIVAPMLASFFLFIVGSNLIAMLPIPVLNRPPTSHFGATLALALCSVIGTLIASALIRGPLPTLKHLFWPNPMQWISEVTDVLSLSLRLFGNIAGEFMTVTLVLGVVPYGIPLILHALGLIPVFVQALVFTLLTSSFMASAIQHQKRPALAEETAPAAADVQGALPEGRGRS